MTAFRSLVAGLSGAIALTVAHQLLKKTRTDSPRMDLLGEEALLKAFGDTQIPLSEEAFYNTTMGLDIVANSIFYGAAVKGGGENAVAKGVIAGTAAGIGGVCLPKYLGLDPSHSNRTWRTKLMTVGLYALGGLVAGKVSRTLGKR